MEAKLSAKLQLLELTRGKTKDVAFGDNLEKIRRHKEALQTIVAGVEKLKRDIEQEKQMCPSAAVLHDITVFSKNRVYFTGSILKVQCLAHTLHEIVTFLNL